MNKMELIITEEKTYNYCSLKTETEDEKKAYFNAVTNADCKLKLCAGEVINLVGVIMESQELVNEKTDEVEPSTRTTLIDSEGVSYGTNSMPFAKSLIQLCNAYGMPHTWTKPMPIKIALKPTRAGNEFLTFTLA